MLKKRKARELAMQVLFLWDTHSAADHALAAQVVEEGTADDETRRQGLRIAGEAWNNREIADQWIERLAPQWPPRRQPGVDRSILRLAAWELSTGRTPPKVVIDEAIEMAKSFSTSQSPGFINGVLDAMLKEMQALTGEAPAAGPNDEPRMTNQ